MNPEEAGHPAFNSGPSDQDCPPMFYEYLKDRYWVWPAFSNEPVCLTKADAILYLAEVHRVPNKVRPNERYTLAEYVLHGVRMDNARRAAPTDPKDYTDNV